MPGCFWECFVESVFDSAVLLADLDRCPAGGPCVALGACLGESLVESDSTVLLSDLDRCPA